MDTSYTRIEPESVADAPRHNRVRDLILDFAHSGPSTRTLVIVIAVALMILLSLALVPPRKATPLDQPLATGDVTAVAPPNPVAAAAPAIPETAPTRGAFSAPVATVPAATSAPPIRREANVSAAPPAITPAVASVSARPTAPEAPAADPSPPKGLVLTPPNPLPVGATSRPQIELTAAPAQPRERDGGAAAAEVAGRLIEMRSEPAVAAPARIEQQKFEPARPGVPE